MRIPICLYMLPILLILVAVGCFSVGPYGSLQSAWRHEGLTIDMLHDNWEDYHVYWAGPSKAIPAGLLFDPKGDDRTIVPDKWDRVTSQEEVAEVMEGVGFNTRFYARLYQVMGPDNQSYGFVYTAWGHVYTKALDPKTLWMENLPLPPLDNGAELESHIFASSGARTDTRIAGASGP